MSVDERTRIDGQVDPVDPRTCFETLLPAAFEREQDLLAAALEHYAPRPLTIDVDGDAWTLAVDGGVVRVRAGRGAWTIGRRMSLAPEARSPAHCTHQSEQKTPLPPGCSIRVSCS